MAVIPGYKMYYITWWSIAKKYEKNCPSGKMFDCTRMYQCVKNGCVF